MLEGFFEVTHDFLNGLPILEPLRPFRDQLTVVSNIGNKPGESRAVHALVPATWLSCVHPKEALSPEMAPTADQIAAARIGQDTPYPSLEIATAQGQGQGSACERGYGCAYSGTLSFRNATTPLPVESNPRQLFLRLFGQGELTLAAATLAVTFFIPVFSEITPKVIGATYPEAIALPSAYVLTPLLRIAYPVVWFVNLFVQGLLKIFFIKPKRDTEGHLSMEELRTLVLEGGKFIPKKHQSIFLNLFELEDMTVDDTMTPRGQIESIDVSCSQS